MSFIITVDRAGLQDGSACQPIRVEDSRTGLVTQHAEVELHGNVRIVYGPRRRDGARVWIEASQVAGVR